MSEVQPIHISDLQYHVTSTVCDVGPNCGLVGYHIHVKDQIFFNLEELHAVWPYESIVQDADLEISRNLMSRTPMHKKLVDMPTFTSTVSNDGQRLRIMVVLPQVGERHKKLQDHRIEVGVSDVNSVTEYRGMSSPIIQIHPDGQVIAIDWTGAAGVIGYWRDR